MSVIVLPRHRPRGNAVPTHASLVPARGAALGLGVALVLCAGPAVAHETLHEVRHGAAVAVRTWESDGDPVAAASWEAWSPAQPGQPWVQGRTDQAGWLAFVPDRPGTWRVRVIEAAGHGLDIGVEVAAGPAATSSTAPPASPPAASPAGAGAAYFVRLVLGLAALGAIFAALVLARRKKDAARGP